MKKRILSAVVCLLLVLTVSFVLFGCKGKNAAVSFKGEEVSEKTWNSFFDNLDENDNWKLEIVESSSGMQNNCKFSIATKTTVVYVKGKSHVTIKYNISGDSINAKVLKVRYADTEYYHDEAEGKFYHADGSEVTNDEKNAPGASYYSASSYFDDMIPSTSYERFKYSKDYHGYVYIASTNSLWVLKFRDGQLAAAYTEMQNYNTEHNRSESHDSYIITYGGQKVNIP